MSKITETKNALESLILMAGFAHMRIGLTPETDTWLKACESNPDLEPLALKARKIITETQKV